MARTKRRIKSMKFQRQDRNLQHLEPLSEEDKYIVRMSGYKKGLIDSRMKNINNGLKYYLIVAGGLSCFLFLGLTLDFSGFILFN